MKRQDKILLVHEEHGPLLGWISGIPMWNDGLLDECILYDTVNQAVETINFLKFDPSEFKFVQVFSDSEFITIDRMLECL